MLTDHPIIFIIGVGRSGTSLLQSMLDAHPEIGFIPEIHFLRNYIFDSAQKKDIENGGEASLKATLASDDYYKRLKISVDEVLEKLDGKSLNLIQFYLLSIRQYLGGKTPKYFGDKDPRNIDHIPLLKHYFPQAKVIHIFRDPRDIIASKMKAAWSAHRPYWQHAVIGEAQIKRGRRNGQQYFGDQFYELSYEALLQNPELELSKLCVFLGLPFSTKMLQFINSSKALVDQSEMAWKKETLKPLVRNNSGKWNNQLSSFQAAFAEAVSTTYFSKLAYQAESFPKQPFYSKLLLKLIRLFQPIFEIFYYRFLIK